MIIKKLGIIKIKVMHTTNRWYVWEKLYFMVF
jgi:hypothetical protein